VAAHVVLPALLVMLTAVFVQMDAAHVGEVRRAKTLVSERLRTAGADLPNVYLKVTPRTFDQVLEGKASAETYFPKLVSVFGADRMAFGSNYPSSEGDLPDIVSRAKSVLSCLPDDQKHMVLAGTAQILYPALAD
jgi:predicted TIM-barrel fold metal-dependent hydrolase